MKNEFILFIWDWITETIHPHFVTSSAEPGLPPSSCTYSTLASVPQFENSKKIASFKILMAIVIVIEHFFNWVLSM